MRVNRLWKLLCGFVIGVMTFLAASVPADTPAFVLGSVLTNQPWSFTGSRGWQFRHGPDSTTDDILITQLGVFDSGGDGLVNAHQIGLWRVHTLQNNDTGTLLASATVPAGTVAPLIDGYRWISISPVLIPYASGPLVVAAQYSEGDADDLVTPRPAGTLGNYQFAPDISVYLVAGRVGLGADLPFPANFTGAPCEGCPSPLFFEPNFQYTIVPEPSAWLLLSPALFYLLLRSRRKFGSNKGLGSTLQGIGVNFKQLTNWH